MTSVLVYSMKSPFCVELLNFINEHEVFKTIIKFHDVNAHGVPNGITRVPSLITNEGKVIIGGDIKTFLDGFVLADIEPVDSSTGTFGIDGNDMSGNWFDIERFGQTLKPTITKEIEEKISVKLEDALASLKR